MSGAAAILEVEGRRVALDEQGFVTDSGQWSPAVARAMAARDGIELGPDHWWLIDFVREHVCAYGNPPLMRVAVAALRELRGEASSRDLYRLFPAGPVREACRYGGLARPDWCI